MDNPHHSRAPSGVTLREYYRGKSEQAAAAYTGQPASQPGGSQPPEQEQSGVALPPRRQSAMSKLLRHISPHKARNSSSSSPVDSGQPSKLEGRKQDAALAAPAQHGSHGGAGVGGSGTAKGASSEGASDGILAFRPASPPMQQCMTEPDDGSSSPGKAQLQALRAVGARPTQAHWQQQQQQQEAPPQGTPGLSEASSMMRQAINAQIANSIADMLMVTPPVQAFSGGGSSDDGSTSAPHNRCLQQPVTATAATHPVHASERASNGTRRPLHTAAGGSGSSRRGGSASKPTPPRARAASRSPFWKMPVPPPAPASAAPLTAAGDSKALEPQSFKSPMFMSRRTRSLYCELDEPGTAIVFPKAHRRTGSVKRFVASVFGCFVPPPSERSPAPSLHTPGGRWTPSSQGASPPEGPQLAFGMDPLRQSLVELTLGDPKMRDHLHASLAPAGNGLGSMRPSSLAAAEATRLSPLYSDLLGLQQGEEDEQANMASPVLPSRPASGGGTPAGLAQASEDEGEEWEEGEEPPAVLAKRNLMDVLRSREAGAVRQHLQRQQQQQWHAPSPHRHHAGRPQSAHHLQPWQRQQQAAVAPAGAGAAKATHVSLAQLLGVPEAKAQARQHSQAAPLLRQGAGDEGNHKNKGAKRGRDALGVSRAPSDDAPSFTPKRRDLSKPSYRSAALHQLLSPLLTPLGGAARPASGGAAAKGGNAAQRGAAAAGSRPGSGHALRRSTSAPASPLRAAAAAEAKGSSAPSSPFVAPRINRAAAARAAVSQRKLQEQDAGIQAAMAKSPDRWMRAAAAEGLSLREAAVFSSPGKSARPYYNPLPAAVAQRPQHQACKRSAAMVAAAAATPGVGRFDSFASGEAGVEPYSARLHTVDRLRPVPAGSAAAAVAARPVMPPQAQQSSWSEADFMQVAADGGVYLQMLHRLASGLGVEKEQIEPHKQPTLPPLPAHLLAGAAAASRQQRQLADGADTVRPRLSVSQEALASSRTTGSTAEYCLSREASHSSADLAGKLPGHPRVVPLTPHHNALFGKDATPTKSSPVAQQRMVSLSAAALAAEQHLGPQHAPQPQQQRRQQHQHDGVGASSRQASSVLGASSASASISFGSGGCITSTAADREEASDESAGAHRHQAAHGRGAGSERQQRLVQLAALLEAQEARGEHFTLAQLQAEGFSTHDLYALKQWLAQQ